MANTYFLIATTNVAAGGASYIEFTNIPNTWTDLVIYNSIRTNRASVHESLLLQFNNETANRLNRRMYHTTGTNSTTDTIMYGGQATGASAEAGVFGASHIYISGYKDSKATKVSFEYGSAENNINTYLRDFNANTWTNSSAITSVRITPENGGTIQQYSTASLYGISKS
jgi:hypothetical protein